MTDRDLNPRDKPEDNPMWVEVPSCLQRRIVFSIVILAPFGVVLVSPDKLI